MPEPVRKPLVVSHRTHAGTHPENTLFGIQAALDDGVDAIEVDVRRTIDGGLVLMHDAAFTRTTGDRRIVSETGLAEATALQVLPRDPEQQPQPVPLLEDALRLIDGRAAVVIDFVDEPITEDLTTAVNNAGAGSWTWWTTHNPRLAKRLAAAVPGSRSYLGWSHSDGRYASPVDAIDVCVRRGLSGINARHTAINETVVRYARREGVEVGAWTVNDPKRMQALIGMGVDLVTSDYPRAVQLLRDRSSSLFEAERITNLRWPHRPWNPSSDSRTSG